MHHYFKTPIDNIHKIFTAFLLIMVLAGCGFHLRGNYTFPALIQKLYISPDDALSPLQKNIRRTLARNQVTIVSTQSAETPTLHLSEPIYTEQSLATAADAQNQRIRITMSFNYHVTLAAKLLRPDTAIQVTRDMSLNSNALLTGENERRLIKDELLKEGVSQLLRQLTTLTDVSPTIAD